IRSGGSEGAAKNLEDTPRVGPIAKAVHARNTIPHCANLDGADRPRLTMISIDIASKPCSSVHASPTKLRTECHQLTPPVVFLHQRRAQPRALPPCSEVQPRGLRGDIPEETVNHLGELAVPLRCLNPASR